MQNGAPGGTYWGPRVIFRSKAAKVCPQRWFFSHCGEVFEGILGNIFHDVLEGRFLDENCGFFEKWCFASTRASLLKVRCRFGEARDWPKRPKGGPGERKKRGKKKCRNFNKKRESFKNGTSIMYRVSSDEVDVCSF